MLVHHLLTVAGSRPIFSANHFAVRFCSTRTTFKRLMSPFEMLLALLVLSILLMLFIYLFLCVWCKVVNNFCNMEMFCVNISISCVCFFWGGGDKIARKSCCKDEKHSRLSCYWLKWSFHTKGCNILHNVVLITNKICHQRSCFP